jgi:hypothetical protein
MIYDANAAPLTDLEQAALDLRLSQLPPSTARELNAGVESLPAAARARALYNWAVKTKIPAWYRRD